jgi:deoxyribodipyrimidine photo-lyase
MTRCVVNSSPTLLWFRQDLRLADHPALRAALDAGAPVIPVFIWSPEEDGAWPPGAASRWWLHHSLASLDASLRARGSRLIVRRGPALAVLRSLVEETGAARVAWHRCCEPARRAVDAAIEAALRQDRVRVETFNGSLLVEPSELRTGAGGPFKIFTPFWRALVAGPPPEEPLASPKTIPAPARWPASDELAALDLLPRIAWAGGLREAWMPGEAGALRLLDAFLDSGGHARYDAVRDMPGRPGTSRLSPHLHWGEISPRQAWAAARARAGADGRDPWLRQIAWREFAQHCLVHFPHAPDAPLREPFASFPWESDPEALAAWQRGATGYPLVDAGMRELWTTGFMHNRVRMVVASFLVKHLLVPWQDGERWFWDTLVDADLANNALSWQWVAGCGLDATPYFRIFNPVTQGKKFDAAGTYVRRWVQEIASLPDAFIHEPWTAPPLMLRQAGIELGGTYPRPIVDHAWARERALAALRSTKG